MFERYYDYDDEKNNEEEENPKTRKQHLYKILIIGDPGTGKSSIIRQFVQNTYTQHYKATIGVDFATKILIHEDGSLLRLQLWDVSGQDRFSNLTRVYFKDAHGAIVVTDCLRKDTMDGGLRWKNDLDNKLRLADGNFIPTICVANKCDMKQDIDVKSFNKFAIENNFTKGMICSAKENIGIDDLFSELSNMILKIDKEGLYEIPPYLRDSNVYRLSDLTSEIYQRIDRKEVKQKGFVKTLCC
uniref:Ras-related protein Rab n=1 Tax=Parastrongyloides trichosuri TaxID=131310 RepID=A0A0N4Z5V4_PARTI